MSKPRNKRCGRSGVELAEIRRHVSLEGEAPKLVERPNSVYHADLKKSKDKGIDHPRIFFPGLGDFKPSWKRGKPKLNPNQIGMLLLAAMDKAREIPMDNKIMVGLQKKSLTVWLNARWTVMAEGKRVADLYRIK